MAKSKKPSLNVAAPGMSEAVERAKESFINGTKIVKKISLPEPSETVAEAALPVRQSVVGISSENDAEKVGVHFTGWTDQFFKPDAVMKEFQNYVRMHYVFLLQYLEIVNRTVMTPFTCQIDPFAFRISSGHAAQIPPMAKLLEILLEQADVEKLQKDAAAKPVFDAGIQALTEYRKYYTEG